jgi:hypothetical protein
VIWRWLAVMLALPTLGLILFLPLMWPVWLGLWGFLVIKGFGSAAAMGARKTRTRLKLRPTSAGASRKGKR